MVTFTVTGLQTCWRPKHRHESEHACMFTTRHISFWPTFMRITHAQCCSSTLLAQRGLAKKQLNSSGRWWGRRRNKNRGDDRGQIGVRHFFWVFGLWRPIPWTEAGACDNSQEWFKRAKASSCCVHPCRRLNPLLLLRSTPPLQLSPPPLPPRVRPTVSVMRPKARPAGVGRVRRHGVSTRPPVLTVKIDDLVLPIRSTSPYPGHRRCVVGVCWLLCHVQFSGQLVGGGMATTTELNSSDLISPLGYRSLPLLQW